MAVSDGGGVDRTTARILLGALSAVIGLVVGIVFLWFTLSPMVAGLQAAHYGCSFVTGGDIDPGGRWICNNNMVYVLPVFGAGLLVAVLVAVLLYVLVVRRRLRHRQS